MYGLQFVCVLYLHRKLEFLHCTSGFTKPKCFFQALTGYALFKRALIHCSNEPVWLVMSKIMDMVPPAAKAEGECHAFGI